MNAVNIVQKASAVYAVQQNALLKNFDLFATAPEGVARLRELIFSLASLGRLVTSAEVVPLERLDKVAEFVMGQAPPGIECNTTGNGTIFVKTGEFGAIYPEVREWTTKPLKMTRLGDVLICVVGATIGKLNLAIDCAIGRSVAAIRPLGELDTKYLYFSLMPFTIALRRDSRGSAQGVIGKTELGNIKIRVPSKEEQFRIVARVEELMQLCDALEQQGKLEAAQHARLMSTLFDALANSESAHALAENWQRVAACFDLLLDRPEAVDALEQTLLRLAVRGLLVPQDPKDEPASELLKKIRTEKDHLIATGKIKRDKPLPEISEEEKPFELPLGWEWVRMYEVAESRLGKMLDKAKNTGKPYPYLRNTNVQWERFELDDVKEIYLEQRELSEYLVQYGDLLICEGGEPGRCAIWRNERDEIYFQKALHRVRPLGDVMAEYLLMAIKADAQSGHLNQFFTGATIKHFAGQELNRYFFPLPPLAEQARIVARVAELRQLCTDLRARLNAARTTQTRLAETLVEHAA